MSDITTDSRILSSSHSWSGKPWQYSCMCALRFQENGEAELIYGIGQTIFAVLAGRWTLPRPGALCLTFLESPPFQRFRGFTPNDDNRVKELAFALIEGEVSGIESIVARPYRFRWTLELSDSPFPDGLPFPSPPPHVFHGHEETKAGPA